MELTQPKSPFFGAVVATLYCKAVFSKPIVSIRFFISSICSFIELFGLIEISISAILYSSIEDSLLIKFFKYSLIEFSSKSILFEYNL